MRFVVKAAPLGVVNLVAANVDAEGREVRFMLGSCGRDGYDGLCDWEAHVEGWSEVQLRHRLFHGFAGQRSGRERGYVVGRTLVAQHRIVEGDD